MKAKDFWNRVKILIKSNNTTQEGLSLDIGFSFHTLQGQIVKNRLPDVETAFKIAQSLHTTVEFLVTGKQLPDPKYLSLKNDMQKLLDTH